MLEVGRSVRQNKLLKGRVDILIEVVCPFYFKADSYDLSRSFLEPDLSLESAFVLPLSPYLQNRSKDTQSLNHETHRTVESL